MGIGDGKRQAACPSEAKQLQTNSALHVDRRGLLSMSAPARLRRAAMCETAHHEVRRERIGRGQRLDRRKKLPTSRTVWRITADAPLGELVEVDTKHDERRAIPADRRAGLRDEPPPPIILDPAPPASFHDSTTELMQGLDVTDETDSIPGELFDKLFQR